MTGAWRLLVFVKNKLKGQRNKKFSRFRSIKSGMAERMFERKDVAITLKDELRNKFKTNVIENKSS